MSFRLPFQPYLSNMIKRRATPNLDPLVFYTHLLDTYGARAVHDNMLDNAWEFDTEEQRTLFALKFG